MCDPVEVTTCSVKETTCQGIKEATYKRVTRHVNMSGTCVFLHGLQASLFTWMIYKDSTSDGVRARTVQ